MFEKITVSCKINSLNFDTKKTILHLFALNTNKLNTYIKKWLLKI